MPLPDRSPASKKIGDLLAVPGRCQSRRLITVQKSIWPQSLEAGRIVEARDDRGPAVNPPGVCANRFPVILGLALALASALATNVAFLFKHRGAVLAPPVQARHPLRSAAGLFRSRWFAIGWTIAIIAWLLHVGALALAPLSIVQAVLSGGLVFLALLGERYFGFRLGRWQWMGVTITAAGLVVIGLTGGGATRPQHADLAPLISVECGVFAIGAALLAVSRHRLVLHRAEGLLLGLAAGALFGVSNVAIKYLTHAPGALYGLVSPWTLTALIAGAISFYASARSLQLGPGVEVIALTSVAANLTAIIGGILVFDEPIGSGPLEIGARFLAFCLVIVGAAVMPTHRAEHREPVDGLTKNGHTLSPECGTVRKAPGPFA